MLLPYWSQSYIIIDVSRADCLAEGFRIAMDITGFFEALMSVRDGRFGVTRHRYRRVPRDERRLALVEVGGYMSDEKPLVRNS